MQKSYSWAHLKNLLLFVIACIFLVGAGTIQVMAGPPAGQETSHKSNRLKLWKSNSASFAGGLRNFPGILDVFTGATTWIGSEFPIKSQLTHIENGAFWIGALVGGDTLVSLGWPSAIEFHPDEAPIGYLIQRSTLDPNSPAFQDAISEEDYIAVYTDTFKTSQLPWIGYDEIDLRPHKPLNIEITETSYAWSLGYAEDFILYDLKITNIGDDNLRNLYFGIYIDPEVGWIGRDDISIGGDDICGYIKSYKAKNACGFIDTLNMAWLADNDGDPYEGEFLERGPPYKSSRHAMAAAFLGLPSGEIRYSFNWWNKLFPRTPPYFDFGPRRREHFRNFGTGRLGRPAGDRNKYHMLSNGEIDYDIPLSTIKQFDLEWMYPDRRLYLDQTDGYAHKFLYSAGPFNLSPGSTIPIVFVITAGENLHTNPRNLENIYRGDVDAYYANLDFSDLIKNAQWARWIYDNPGIDTDNDGYAGEFRVCVFDSVLDNNSNWIATVAETTWYKGDGVPDWRAALPPPAPKIWLTPTFKGINIRFNGQESENTPDIFTRLLDFEGYKIYIARDDRETSYSLLASYDIENYDKFIWNYDKQPEAGWELLNFPMTLREIRCAYGSASLTTGATACDDSLFDFLRFRPSFPYSPPNFPESLFYFVKHESNVSEFGVTTPITKRFPNSPDPRGLPLDSITADFYTDDGYLKFFEYEFTIGNIIPTVVYYVSVTAMDFGWPK